MKYNLYFVFRPVRLRNIDRSSARSFEVTVNNVTVTITDYKPLASKKERGNSQQLTEQERDDAEEDLSLNSSESPSTSPAKPSPLKTPTTTSALPAQTAEEDDDAPASSCNGDVNGKTWVVSLVWQVRAIGAFLGVSLHNAATLSTQKLCIPDFKGTAFMFFLNSICS